MGISIQAGRLPILLNDTILAIFVYNQKQCW